MTFATEAQKSASERFLLVRVEPRKYMGLGTLVDTDTFTFPCDLPRVDSVDIDGSSASVISYSLSNSVLTVVSPVDIASSSHVVTADFHQFYTGVKLRDTSGNTAGIPDEIWEPYIENYPQFSQSMRNISDGIFSISNTEIALISENRLLHGYFGDNYSWYNAPVSVWSCINDINTARLVFTGNVSKASLTSRSVSLSVLDSFQKLNQSAMFGRKDQSFVYTGNTNAPYPNSSEEGQVIPLVIGESSPLFVSNNYRHLDSYGTSPSTFYHLSDGLKAIKISPETPTGTSDISFVAGRILSSDIKKLDFGTITAGYRFVVTRTITGDISGGAPDDPVIWTEIIFVQCTTFNGEIGDYISSFTVNGSPRSGWVCKKTTFTQSGTDYNVAIQCSTFGEVSDDNTTTVPSNGSVTVVISNNTHPSMSVWVEGGDNVKHTNYYVPLALVPSTSFAYHDTRYLPVTYSIDPAYTWAGKSIRQVNFVINPTTAKMVSDDGSNQLASATIKCRFSPATPMTHGEALEFILNSAGMDTNTSTFNDADTYLDSYVSMCIPNTNDTNFPTYLESAQSVTSSTLGIVRANESRECEYYILDDIRAGTSIGTRDVINTLEGSTGADIDYQDIYSKLTLKNPVYLGIEASSGSSGPSAVIQDLKSQYLHRIDRVKEINHVLTNIYLRTDAMTELYTRPKVEYTLSTSSEDLATNIGDLLTLDNPVVADTSSTTEGIVVDIQTSLSKSTIVINELRGLT